MPSDNHMSYRDILDTQQVQKMDQAKSSLKDVATLLYLHFTELVAAGFKKSQAYEMTLQMHAVLMENTFGRMGE
jgi:hypothetical protein